MPIKIKNIPYVNELEIMGTKNGVLNANTANELVVQNFNSLKNFIPSFYSFLKDDLKLIPVTDPNQIDVNNLPVFEMVYPEMQEDMKKRNILNQYFSKSYGYNVFTFDDEYQSTKPIILKFDYRMVNFITKQDTPANCPRFAFAIELSIIDSTTKVDIYKTLLWSGYFNPPYDTNGYLHMLSNPTDSVGFYNKSKLYLNIMPRKSFSACTANSANFPPRLGSYMNIYIERNEKYLKVIKLCDIRNISVNNADSAFNTLPVNIQYIPYGGGAITANSSGVYIPYDTIKSTNTAFPAFKTIDINPVDNKIEESKNVMVTYSSLQSDSYSNIVQLKNSKGETNNYLVNNTLGNIYYVGKNVYSIMFKVD